MYLYIVPYFYLLELVMLHVAPWMTTLVIHRLVYTILTWRWWGCKYYAASIWELWGLEGSYYDEQYDGYDETRIRMPSQMRRNEGLDNFLAASRFMKKLVKREEQDPGVRDCQRDFQPVSHRRFVVASHFRISVAARASYFHVPCSASNPTRILREF